MHGNCEATASSKRNSLKIKYLFLLKKMIFHVFIYLLLEIFLLYVINSGFTKEITFLNPDCG